jgi:hypothetical protein
MPRPVSPPSMAPPDVQQLIRPLKTSHSDLARALGLRRLSDELAATLQEAIAVYRASLMVAPTKGQVRTLVLDLQKAERPLSDALAPFLSENSSIDIETFAAFEATAKKCMATLEKLDSIAAAQIARLKSGPRVIPATECLSQFSGILGKLFHKFADPDLTKPQAATKCLREFALIMFEEAGIENADYYSHPERLDEMLRTDATAAAPPLSIEGTVRGSFDGVRF